MSFLPIVERELRAAARRRGTYRARTAFAVLASALAAGFLLVGSFGSARQVGGALFRGLSVLGFLYCLLAGIRHASDALSEEKREGTLGLLFLTNLHSFDIVAGKLVSISTRTLQELLAFFPVLAIGLVLGGMTAGEFWRETGVLVNALFFSLSVGLWVSALSFESHKALAAAFLVVAFLTFAPFGAGWLGAKLGFSPELLWLTALSPATAAGYASDVVYQMHPARFGWVLILNHGFAWLFLAMACVALPHRWQDRRSLLSREPARARRSEARSSARSSRLGALRKQLLEINPVLWLAARKEGRRRFILAFSGVTLLTSLIVAALSWELRGATLGLAPVSNFLLSGALKLWLAWQACATLSEARRSGGIELILATPLTVQEIIQGQRQALHRFFFWPVVAALILRLAQIIGTFFLRDSSQSILLWVPLPAMILFHMVTFVLDMIAIGWVGMWMGLTQKKTVQAFARTVVLSMIAPEILFCLPNIVWDLFWMNWARRKLEMQFRAAAADSYGTATPTPLALALPFPPGALPPVIGRQSEQH